VPRRAPELAVGRGAQARVLLLADSLGDRLVLDRAQARWVKCAAGEPLARLEQPPRAEEAADVVGTERGRVEAQCPEEWNGVLTGGSYEA